MSTSDGFRRQLGPVLHPTDLGERARQAEPHALFLAALAEGVIRRAPCPVLTVSDSPG